jgi:DNA topoisomerase 2-associated protein PAT1
MSPDQMAQAQALHERITSKIKAMATYNNCMGASDKDFITRIQLAQLATADPYTSDFYAQVYSAIHKARQPDQAEGPTVVKVGQDAGFGVGGPTGNRFGQMGNKTMQKLSSQVKKLVEQRNNRQMSNGELSVLGMEYTKRQADNVDALQGALGRISRTSVTAPKPVLAVPSAKAVHAKMPQLNQAAGVHRQALTRRQVLVAIEGLYDAILDLEQTRRDMPSPDATLQLEAWNAACQAKSADIWRRLMVQEPLDIRCVTFV